MRVLIQAFRDLWGLPSAFADLSFGHTPDGRPVFMPYGLWGGSYVVESQTRLRSMRNQLGLLFIMPAVTFLALVSLSLRPIRETALSPVLIFVVVSFAAFTFVFVGWAWFNTRTMSKLEEGERGIPVSDDPLEVGASSVQRFPNSFGAETTDLLCVSGALAGFACQMVARDRTSLEGRPSGFAEVTLQDGRVLQFGDNLNGPLAEDETSVWSIVGDGAPVADIKPFFSDAIAVLTNEITPPAIGSMVISVQRLWPAIVLILDGNNVPVTSRHLAIARAVRSIQHTQQVLPFQRCVEIAMRAAIIMSKWDAADVLAPNEAA